MSFKESPDAVNRNFKEFIIKSLCNSSVGTMYNIVSSEFQTPTITKKIKNLCNSNDSSELSSKFHCCNFWAIFIKKNLKKNWQILNLENREQFAIFENFEG